MRLRSIRRSEIVTSTANNAAGTRVAQACYQQVAPILRDQVVQGRVQEHHHHGTEIVRTHVVKLWMVQVDPVAELFNSKLEHYERFNGIGSLVGVADLAMESQQAIASAAALDGEAASAFDAENSDLATKIDVLTRALAALEKGAAGSDFLQSGVGSTHHPQIGFEFQQDLRRRPFHVVFPVEQ